MKGIIKNTFFPCKFRFVILSLLLPFFACSCSSINPARMTPQINTKETQAINRCIRDIKVTGGKDSTFMGPELVNNDDFKSALVSTLEKSRLFSSINTHSGDINLYATIRSQNQSVGSGLEYRAMLIVSYKFVDNAGNVIWLESYKSEFSSVAFAGSTRTVEAREGSVRENLRFFIQGIKERWPR